MQVSIKVPLPLRVGMNELVATLEPGFGMDAQAHLGVVLNFLSWRSQDDTRVQRCTGTEVLPAGLENNHVYQ
eukprot:3139125-Pyramimonas_sp.AAC.1